MAAKHFYKLQTNMESHTPLYMTVWNQATVQK